LLKPGSRAATRVHWRIEIFGGPLLVARRTLFHGATALWRNPNFVNWQLSPGSTTLHD